MTEALSVICYLQKKNCSKASVHCKEGMWGWGWGGLGDVGTCSTDYKQVREQVVKMSLAT